MAKALYGSVTTPSQLRMLDEIRALRRRVAELEAALDEATEAADRREDVVVELDEAAAGANA